MRGVPRARLFTSNDGDRGFRRAREAPPLLGMGVPRVKMARWHRSPNALPRAACARLSSSTISASRSCARICVDGFRKTLFEALGGVHGCTHITELLSYLPTAAVQTFAGLTREDAGERKPFQLDRCHALETSSETVRRYYPKWYRGAA